MSANSKRSATVSLKRREAQSLPGYTETKTSGHYPKDTRSALEMCSILLSYENILPNQNAVTEY